MLTITFIYPHVHVRIYANAHAHSYIQGHVYVRDQIQANWMDLKINAGIDLTIHFKI